MISLMRFKSSKRCDSFQGYVSLHLSQNTRPKAPLVLPGTSGIGRSG